MADDLQKWLVGLPDALVGELEAGFAEIVADHADAIGDAAPEGDFGNTKQSVRVTPGRKPLSCVIEAGGPLTTKDIRAGSGVAYDYANAGEFGTSRQPARPWFYSTHRARQGALANDLDDLVSGVVAKL